MTEAKLPNNPEAEQTLLGCILLQRDSLNEVVAEYPMAAELFYDFRHKTIFEAIRDGNEIEPIALAEILKNRGDLEKVGGIAYLVSLPNKVGSGNPQEARHFADILVRDYLRRRLIEVGYTMQRSGTEAEDASEALEAAERSVMAIGGALQADCDLDIKTIMRCVINEMEEAHDGRGKIRGLCVGFSQFDWMTNGLKPGQMIVIAARPGVGKTSLAMNMAEHVAVEQRFPVGVFSLEMTAIELAHRMACSRAEVDSTRAGCGDFQEGDMPKLAAVTSQISASPLFICEKGGLTISQLSARARRMHQRHKLRLMVVDYLQLMGSRIRGNRNEQITEISNGVKSLAKDLKIPIIILSQLSRDVEKNDREPRLSDLRDSGSIEQDADIVMLLSPKEIKDDIQQVDGLIPKHRGGKVGKIEFNFRRQITRFEARSNFGLPNED